MRCARSAVRHECSTNIGRHLLVPPIENATVQHNSLMPSCLQHVEHTTGRNHGHAVQGCFRRETIAVAEGHQNLCVRKCGSFFKHRFPSICSNSRDGHTVAVASGNSHYRAYEYRSCSTCSRQPSPAPAPTAEYSTSTTLNFCTHDPCIRTVLIKYNFQSAPLH